VIVYSLRCGQSHEFEAWFRDSSAFEKQSAEGKLVCPICETRSVSKAPMAPAIAGTRRKEPQGTMRGSDELKKMRQFMTGLRKFVQENAEYVGPRFPEEARKIHYGETEHRHIYGEASLKEASELIDEGVDVAPLPPDIDEAN